MPAPTRFKKHPLTIAIQACCYTMLSGSPLALATPTGGTVVGGTGTISQSGNTTTINQATQNLAINWQTFDVAANERVNFIQPNSNSVAFNRILSNNGSTIAGRIDANGKVILVNANGIFFTSTAVLNVGSIIASGLDMSPNDFMNGQYVFNEIQGTSGAVVNSGLINASLGGNVALIGKQVRNDGLIVANLGTVTLAAGKQAVLTFDNSGLLGVRVTQEVLQSELGVDPAVLNSGEIRAQGGRVLLTASQSQDVFSRAVNNSGLEPATSVVMNDDGSFTLGNGADVVNSGAINVSTTSADQTAGRIVLIGENVTSSGTLRADTVSGNGGEIELHARDTTLLTQNSLTSARSESNGNGGIVKVLGDKVGLFDQSTIDVSGANGGGQALIGGDFQGSNPNIRNASRTYVSVGSAIYADAFQQGNGGKIINWGNDYTWFYGNAFSRGGNIRGDGGLVEISGKGLFFNGDVDTSAMNGSTGVVLFDPTDIVIHAGNGPSPNDNSQLTDSQILAAEGSGTTFNISENAFLALSGTNNILLQATNNITINNDVGTLVLPTQSGSTVTFTADADSNGFGSFSMNPTDRIQTAGGNVSISGASVTTGRIITNGGDVTLTLRPNSTGSINLGGNITTGGGAANFNGNVILTDAITVNTTGSTTGNILFSGTINSNPTATQNLTLVGRNITFSGAVGNTNQLGNMQIYSNGIINAGGNAFTASSLYVASGLSFTSGAITTTSLTDDINITSGDIRVGTLVSGDDVFLTASDNGTPSITLDGDISTQGVAELLLNGNTGATGSVTINYTGDFTSNVDIAGSDGIDTLYAANRTNTWVISSAGTDYSGSLNVGNAVNGVTFSNFETLNGGTGTDSVNLSALSIVNVDLGSADFNSIEEFIGNGSNSTLRGDNILNDWEITGVNSGTLNTSITFSGFNNLVGNNATDNFVFRDAGRLNNGGSIDGGAGTNTLAINATGAISLAADPSMALGEGNFTLNGSSTIEYFEINDVTASAGTNIIVNDTDITGTLTLANANSVSITDLSANTLVLNNVGVQAGTAGVPLITDVNNLSILNTGPVFLINDGALGLGPITTTSTVDITAGGAVTGTTALNSTAAFTIRSTGDITLTSTSNALSGAITLQQINSLVDPTLDTTPNNTIRLNNTTTTTLAGINAGNLNIQNSSGNITDAGAVSGAINVADNIVLNTPGTITLDNIDRIQRGDFTASQITLHTANGIGSGPLNIPTNVLTTTTSNLTVVNDSGGVMITNTGDATVTITNLGDIHLTNNGDLIIDRLYTNAGIYAPAGTNPYPTSPYIGSIHLAVNNGSVTAYSGTGSHTAAEAPDIVAQNLTVVMPRSSTFGTSSRYMSLRVQDTFSYDGGSGFVYYYGPDPQTLSGGADDLTTVSSVGGLSVQQLLDLDSLDEFDPAIFTEIRNYYYEDVAILLPPDQRLDSSDDEEKDEEGKEKL